MTQVAHPILTLLELVGPQAALPVQIIGYVLVPEVFMVLHTVQTPALFWCFALAAVAGSCLGGLMDYGFGYAGGRKYYERFVKAELRERLDGFFHRFGAWSLVVGSFIPVSYKALTLGTGVCRVPMPHFLAGMLAGRTLRHFIICTAIFLFGESVLKSLGDTILAVGLGVALAAVAWLVFRNTRGTNELSAGGAEG